jgi:single-stranded-DNA-specific exonuclease
MKFKQVKLREQRIDVAKKIAEDYSLSPLASRVLAARNFESGSELENFLSPALKTGLPNPESLVGLKEATDLIADALARGRNISIACDFDVDGLTGGSQLFDFLKRLGAKTSVLVPDRFSEGYGLNERIVREARDLLITVDFGTTNPKELSLARSLGLKTIVVDHHFVHEAPPCDVFINPQQDGCGFADKILSASGLVWFLLVGLKKRLGANLDLKEFLDLAALGTICDMVPLVSANRVIAKRGLEALSITNRRGLRSLKALAGISNPVTCYDVGFVIGPRINSAGRLVSGQMVVELLTTEDTSRADSIASKLHDLNAERQDIEAEMKAKAISGVPENLPWGIVSADESFHLGVIGIVAQRLAETFYRPAIVLGPDSDGIYKGSVRGIKGFNVVKALSSLEKFLIKFGGHEGAGGLSIKAELISAFRQAWDDLCKAELQDLETEPSIEADTEASLKELHVNSIKELESFAPFGIGNPSPQILFPELKVLDVKLIKSAHLKVTLSDGKSSVPGIFWKLTSHPSLNPGKIVNVVAKPSINSYNGYQDIQLVLSAVQ